MCSNADDHQIKDSLEQLRCHFTWELQIEDNEMPDLENRAWDQIEFLDSKQNVGMHNLLAYVKHLKGQNEEALESLTEAEDLIQRGQTDQADVNSLVTWGNFAWVYYHMGKLTEAQTYLDKVENTCKKFTSLFRYRMECPEVDSKEGWALLKCGGQNYERAKACFEKALVVDPDNPEFSAGYAITMYRLDNFRLVSKGHKTLSLQPLEQALKLNPENVYIKVLLALKLQDLGRTAEGERYIEEGLDSTSSQAYVLRFAAKFYRKKGSLDTALQLLKKALEATPSSAPLHHQIGLCYRAQIIQIKEATSMRPRGQDREKIDRFRHSAIFHFESAVEFKPTFEIAYVHLAKMYVEAGNYRKAEDTYHKVLRMKPVVEETMQNIHFSYGQFQEFQKKSEADAMIHYLKAIQIKRASIIWDKSIYSLKKLAFRKLQRNESDLESLSLLGFAHKMKGNLNEALEYYEKALRLAVDWENSVGQDP
ncbi:interferon-induced protein with tetratricopeptide repeats 1-like isoform X2 [Carlito syrichta]|uniref:Interferon-induced protein with tetratricopeptide repeats 1-like isoform X2 n=1 Tax=Carlito syrichta TaxID=1868482 RepID=A0A1U7T7H4_CARSF|nr:interferon-induced protein with tetratricopeptide repeats 1-like isoform X2 [Carlito syrichta]